ncbi:MAG: DNA methyltransferase [Leucobacter sp.]
MADDYDEFVKAKARFDKHYGFDIDADEINPKLLPHQRAIVQWAVKGGRRAVFCAFGLGKSVMQLETLRLTLKHSGGTRALIIAPLGVRGEFIRDGRELLGIDVRFVRRTEELDGPGIYVTNYESVRDGKLDPTQFDAVSLDEASVLRSFGSKTYQTFLTLFDGVPFRFVATATPSPNRYKELIHYAGYLGVMDTGAALTRWFQRDSTKANNLTLYPHKEAEFFMWLSTWAIFLQSPADLGYDATGYELPPIEIDWHMIDTGLDGGGVDRDGQGQLFKNTAMSLPEEMRVKRDSIGIRVDRMMRLVKQHHDDGPVVIWCTLNAEQEAIEKRLRMAGVTFSSVYGALDPDEAERRIDQWRDGETHALIGKPVMLGQGLNLQRANRAIFVGIDHKFNDLIQAVHRIQRFGQTRQCYVHFIHLDTEVGIADDLRHKWALHEELTDRMTDIIREYGLDRSDIAVVLTRAMGVDRIEASGEGWTLANNDCVKEARDHVESNSVDMVVTSIPFSNHYEYTPNYNDFGHTDDNDHFWAQMDHLTPELLRILKPGRIYACHVKDRILFGNVTGAGVPTVSPFHAEALFHGRKHGFDYLGMITVVTDVVRENNQTYRLGWSEMAKDGTKMGVGSPEYILLFHKPQTDRSRGYADQPVQHTKTEYTRAHWQIDAHAFWRSSGERILTPDELSALKPEDMSRLFTEQTLKTVYDYESHVKLGEELEGRGSLPATFMSLAPGSWHPEVWHDVNRMLTLNGDQKRRNMQMHICPLQFDIVDRLIERFSNPGDLIYDPFMGIGTVAQRALRAGRRARGSELNTGYFLDSVKYAEAEERKTEMPSLFDLI